MNCKKYEFIKELGEERYAQQEPGSIGPSSLVIRYDDLEITSLQWDSTLFECLGKGPFLIITPGLMSCFTLINKMTVVETFKLHEYK